jgi:hypothetical protein
MLTTSSQYALFRVVLTFLLMCAGRPVSAQIGAAEFTGTVHDEARAPIPGVTVSVTNIATNEIRFGVTTTEGVYVVASLAPGQYRFDIVVPGFKSIRRDGIRIATGEKVRLDFEMVIGAIGEEVTVTADTPARRHETASLGTVVEHEQVSQLPLNGRTFITLASLAPGVALPPNSQLPRINGGRPRTNEYLFDGISVLQPEPGQVAFFPIIDGTQEFKIESNSPPAEFGRFNGGVINLTTRSGENAWRGSAFEFLRHQALNARNFFQSTDSTKPEYRRNQFGGTLGGPLVRNRTFFFVDYQGQRQSIGRTVISTVPTVRQRQGIFTEPIAGRVPVIYDPATSIGSTRLPFPGNTIPLERFDSVASSLLQRYPLPTASGTSNNYRRTAAEDDTQNQWDVRIDHVMPGNRDRVFGRFSSFTDRLSPVTPLPEGSGVTTGTLDPQVTRAQSFASNYQHTFGQTLINDLRIGDTRRRVRRSAVELSALPGEALGIPGIPSNGQFPYTLPTFLISGYQQIGSPPNTASNFQTSVTEIANALTWIKGPDRQSPGHDEYRVAVRQFSASVELRGEVFNLLNTPPLGQDAFHGGRSESRSTCAEVRVLIGAQS